MKTSKSETTTLSPDVRARLSPRMPIALGNFATLETIDRLPQSGSHDFEKFLHSTEQLDDPAQRLRLLTDENYRESMGVSPEAVKWYIQNAIEAMREKTPLEEIDNPYVLDACARAAEDTDDIELFNSVRKAVDHLNPDRRVPEITEAIAMVDTSDDHVAYRDLYSQAATLYRNLNNSRLLAGEQPPSNDEIMQILPEYAWLYKDADSTYDPSTPSEVLPETPVLKTHDGRPLTEALYPSLAFTVDSMDVSLKSLVRRLRQKR